MKLQKRRCTTIIFMAALLNQPDDSRCGTIHTPEIKSISAIQIKLMASNTDLAFWGTVQSFEDDGRHHALLNVRIDEPVFGHSLGESTELTVGGLGFPSSRNPRTYLIGERYFFLCFKAFRSKEKSWSEKLSCYTGGVLCSDSTGEKIKICSGEIKFSIKEPLEQFIFEFQNQSVPALFESSDLILRVGEVSLKTKPIEFSNGALRRGEMGIAPVVEVIKGEWAQDKIEFSNTADLGLNSAPIYYRNEDVILFLKKGENGFTLVRNNWGFCSLDASSVYTNKGVFTGYQLVDNKFVLVP